jgi:hypothetical protein
MCTHPVFGIVFLVNFDPADVFYRLGVVVCFVDEVDPQKDHQLVNFDCSIKIYPLIDEPTVNLRLNCKFYLLGCVANAHAVGSCQDVSSTNQRSSTGKLRVRFGFRIEHH